jgi:hypothetical protein
VIRWIISKRDPPRDLPDHPAGDPRDPIDAHHR